MTIMKRKPFRTVLSALVFLLVGVGIGWRMFGGTGHDHPTKSDEHSGHEVADVWTCSMHPQIRQNEPGDCPICGMDLVPVVKMSAGVDIVEMSEEAALLSGIQTSIVVAGKAQKSLHLQGKVQIDERRINNLSSHVPGRIEQLHVSYTGESVSEGQKLASVYSPELISAQKELFEAMEIRDTNPSIYKAARNKLKSWKLSDNQIDEIEKSGLIKEEVEVTADRSGIVIARDASLGDYIKPGDVLFTVADLSRVWVVFDAYETDLQWMHVSDTVHYSVSSVPGQKFKGVISFIDPVISAESRTAAVRLDVDSRKGLLKPEMFVNGMLKASANTKGDALLAPKSAVMWTGSRSVVYVVVPDSPSPMYQFREVTLGEDLGEHFVIEEGLEAGEEIVTNGTFKVDAAAQLAGKKSMMNKEGGKKVGTHDHGQMDNEIEDHGSMNWALFQFKVSGNCEMCEERIEEAAMSVSGVHSAVWNVDSKLLHLQLDTTITSDEMVGTMVAESGHDNDFRKASDDVYDDLPGCCQYDRE
jgi:Cu(I)/Ag(I) efflux system membrane fusion protein